MKQKKSIVYINFAPYDNAGRILDYIIDNYSFVLHFSYDHLRLKKGRRSKLTVYKDKKLILEKKLIWLRTLPILLFPSLPFVAFFIFIQSFFYIAKYRYTHGKFDLYLSVNAYTAWFGNLFQDLGLVKKTVFWVWDYFPVNHPDIRLRAARWIYWRLDKPALVFSDKVVFLNSNLLQARKQYDNSFTGKTYKTIPIGTNPTQKKINYQKKSFYIGHMGMLKSGQGLDLLFDSLPELIELFPSLQVEIIGSGPEESYFKKRARKFTKHVKFYGFIEKDDEVDRLIRRWSIGIATYKPEPWSEHYWTDPSKIKAYINQGTPVITTNVPDFSKEVSSFKAGKVIDYNKEALIKAIKNLRLHNTFYSKNAYKLAQKYNYQNLYPKLF